MSASKTSGKDCLPRLLPRGRGNALENQLIQILSDLQKQISEQRAEAARDREKAALEREVANGHHNQLAVEMEILRKS